MLLKRIGYAVLSSRPVVRATDVFVRRLLGGQVRNRGSLIDTTGPAVTPWVRTLVYWGMYETPELRLVERHLPADLDVVELGGSIGVVASRIARRLDPGRRLVTVEANPKIVDLLRANVERNGPQVRTTVVHGAIGYPAHADEVEMTFGDSTLAAWVSRPEERRPGTRVPVVGLSGLLARHRVGDFCLVADVEGAEADLFVHDKEGLSGCRLMIVELHQTVSGGRRLSIEDLLGLAAEAGFVYKDHYRDVYVLENRPPAAPRPEG